MDKTNHPYNIQLNQENKYLIDMNIANGIKIQIMQNDIARIIKQNEKLKKAITKLKKEAYKSDDEYPDEFN